MDPKPYIYLGTKMLDMLAVCDPWGIEIVILICRAYFYVYYDRYMRTTLLEYYFEVRLVLCVFIYVSYEFQMCATVNDTQSNYENVKIRNAATKISTFSTSNYQSFYLLIKLNHIIVHSLNLLISTNGSPDS